MSQTLSLEVKPDVNADVDVRSPADEHPYDDSLDTKLDGEPCTNVGHDLTGECEVCGSSLDSGRGAVPMSDTNAPNEAHRHAPPVDPTKWPPHSDGLESSENTVPTRDCSVTQDPNNNSYYPALRTTETARFTQTEGGEANMPTRTLSRFLINEGVISHKQLATALRLRTHMRDSSVHGVQTSSKTANSSAPWQEQESRLAEALIHTGALAADQLQPLLAAYARGADSASEFVNALLSERPHSGVLEVITNQLIRSLMNTVGVRVAADGCHTDIQDVMPCDYTIYQSFTGEFQGEVYLNLSASLMLEIASTLIATKAPSVGALVATRACEFLNIANGNACAQLSAMGTKVGLQRPLFFRHPQWGERVGAPFDLAKRIGNATFTAVRLAHPSDRQELCFVDRT